VPLAREAAERWFSIQIRLAFADVQAQLLIVPPTPESRCNSLTHSHAPLRW
jgi:hypothetical protein